MTLRKLSFCAMLVMSLVAGCREEQFAAPAPSFIPPVVRPPTPSSLPSFHEAPPPEEKIASVAPEQLINSLALKPKVKARQWQYIIIHHSDTDGGSAARFNKAHLARGWDGLGYDFVIGNNTETRDGMIEVGPRWLYQKDGAHTGTPDNHYNEQGIGICLVGNFEETRPTDSQMDALARLCAYLMKTYNIPASRIIGHRDAKPTKCPGRHMDLSQVRATAKKYLEQMP